MSFRKISASFPLILASASPRRRYLLEQIGLPYEALPCDIDENSVKGAPFEIACRLAEKKAMLSCSRYEGRWILGADTVVVLEHMVMGKPGNALEAREMLKRLSDREHEVITGFSIINPSGEIAETRHNSTSVSIKRLSLREIDAYIETGEPFGKAGGYGIQGIGSFMVKSIKGSYSNVVGLPLFALIESFIRLNAIYTYPMNFEKS